MGIAMKMKPILYVLIAVKCVLLFACGVLLILKTYVSAGINEKPTTVEKQTIDQNTVYSPLVEAIQAGDKKKVLDLIQAGADLNVRAKNIDGRTPLELAIRGSDKDILMEMVYILIQNGAWVRQTNSTSGQPIHAVVNIGNWDKRMKVLHTLINEGADINAQDNDGNTMLGLSVIMNEKEWIKMLRATVNSMIDFGIKNKKGQDVMAITRDLGRIGDDSVAAALGTDIKPTNTTFNPPVIGQDGDYKKIDSWGYSGLMLAIIRGDQKTAQMLIERGANVNWAVPDTGDTALHIAVRSRNPEMFIKMLLAAGAKVNVMNKKRLTPLMLIVDIADPKVQIDVFKLLVQAGAYLNAQDDSGNTLIHKAVLHKDVDLVKFLKADLGALFKNKDNKSPLDIAKDKKYEDLVKLLEVTQ